MILVRDIFQLRFGRAKEAIAFWKQGAKMLKKAGVTKSVRICTDLTGAYYTLVIETTYEGLAQYEQRMASLMDDEWRAWYVKFAQIVESGSREIFTIVA